MGSNQLREHYLPIVYEQAINKIMNEVRDKHICITVDETMDACGCSAVNILFGYGKYIKLFFRDCQLFNNLPINRYNN